MRSRVSSPGGAWLNSCWEASRPAGAGEAVPEGVAETCICTRPVLLRPDIMVEATLLALNLMVGSSKNVSLLPAAPVLSMLAVTFTQLQGPGGAGG